MAIYAFSIGFGLESADSAERDRRSVITTATRDVQLLGDDVHGADKRARIFGVVERGVVDDKLATDERA